MTRQPLNVAVPWSLSHYIPLNGFHPLYRALFDHVPGNINLFAWDNVKLHRRVCSDAKMRAALLNKAKAEQHHSERLARESCARAYREYLWPPNYVLTTELMGDVEFYHTTPFPSLKRPFVFHCESYAPVLFPFAQQGTGSLEHHEEIREHYQGIFANPLCLGIFSHIPETLQALSQFFSDPIIDQKLFRSRIGLSEKAVLDSALPQKTALSRSRFLFVNSAHQSPASFFRGGGHIALRFWKKFLAEGNDGLLILCCAKPRDQDLSEHGVDVSFLQAQIGRSIIWGQDYLANHEVNALIASSHFLLSPGASLHSVSIMQAMTLGTIPVVTDIVGASVYVTDHETGIVLQGIRGALWHKDAATGILVDRYCRTPDLDDSLVSQLTSRVGALCDAPDTYRKMRDRTMAYAQDQFSGQAFSDHFWGAVSDLYHRERKYFAWRNVAPIKVGTTLFDCTVQDDGWARVFESPTQPLLRINTGLGVVWELGGAMIQAYGNPRIDLNDWSLLAQHYSPGAPQTTFANTLEELRGKYLHSVGHREGVRLELIGWIAKILKPFPLLYRYAARALSKLRRYRRYIVSRFFKPKIDHDIELVQQGVSGYNVIRCDDRYYAIPQSEGEFSPHKADTGGYSSCFSDYSVDQVLQRSAESGPPSLQASLVDDDMGLIEQVCEGFHGFNVIRRGVEFHATLQCEGAFVSEKLESKQYSRSFSGYSLDAVQREIVRAFDSEQGRNEGCSKRRRMCRSIDAKRSVKKPPVHLWLCNHSFLGIGDQVSFIVMALRQHGYQVSVGQQPRHSSLNVVIEGFSSQSRDTLLEFCHSTRKRVAMIMTEHIDAEHGQILVHGAPLGSENDYMHPATILARIKHLLECVPYLRCFFVLGDLPELRNMSTLLPGLDVRAIPFPRLDSVSCKDIDRPSEPVNDLVFTGAMTEYRIKLLALLEAAGLSVASPHGFVSRNRRNAMNRSAKVIVNIPQREGWQWLSLMRIVAGLQTGQATISLGVSDTSQIASCCTQLDIRKQGWISEVKQCVDDWKSLYYRDAVNYSLMAKKFEQERPFPHDVLEYWSITDRVCS